MTGMSCGTRAGGRRGFSLILTLLVVLCGAAMLGAVLNVSSGFIAMSGASTRSKDVYNILQEEIERGKAILKRAMSDESAPLKKKSGVEINALDALLVYEEGNPLCDISKNIRVAGRDARLEVKIYDMGYEMSELPAEPGAELLASLPHSFPMVTRTGLGDESALGADQEENKIAPPVGAAAANAGAYAIRATLTFDDGTGRAIETAVLQAVGEI